MRVLLINPPIRVTKPPTNFPLGLGYIAQVLLDGGHDVTVLDINANRWSKEKVEKKIRNCEYGVIGIGGLLTTYKYVKWLTALIKNYDPNVKIVAGGSLTAIPRLLLEKTHVDIAVIGEGELTIKEVIGALEYSNDLRDVDGIWFKENSDIHQTPSREPLRDLDTLPFPAWDLFPMEKYLEQPNGGSGPLKNMNIESSRGCPYNCIYCYHIFGDGVRLRSVDSMIKEVKTLQEKYGVEYICFIDDLFVVNKKRVHEFCDRIISENISIKFSCMGRVNLVDENLLTAMKSAGCNLVGYGLESGSQKILDIMNKRVTVEQAKKAVKLTQEVGINIAPNFMVGMIGETHETIRESVDFCKETNLSTTFHITQPYPGTPLYEQAKAMGRIDDDERLIEELGDTSKFVVNLTDFSDVELLRLKDEAEADIDGSYKRPSLYKRVLNYYKCYGPRNLLRRVL